MKYETPKELNDMARCIVALSANEMPKEIFVSDDLWKTLRKQVHDLIMAQPEPYRVTIQAENDGIVMIMGVRIRRLSEM